MTIVAAFIGNIIVSRSRIHQRWEQSVERMEKSDQELSEKLHREEAASEERTTQSATEKREQTVAQ